MRLRALLDTKPLGLRLLGGEDELDRAVRGVMTTDLRDPSRYLSGGELVLTGLAWRHAPEDSERFVRILATAGVAGLAAGEAEQGAIPDDLVAACGRHRLPLFAVTEDVAFASITEHVARQVSGERAGDLAAVVRRHRMLMSEGPSGGGPDAVLALLRDDLDLRAYVLSPTGRQIAGVDPPLPPAIGARLAGEHLGALRTTRPAPHRACLRGRWFSVFPISRAEPGAGTGTGPGTGTGTAGVRGTGLSDWSLAVEADSADWPEERLGLVRGVAQLIAVERERRDAAGAVRRRLAQEVLDLVQAGASPPEVAARLRVAGPVLLPGLGTAPHWQVVVARVEWEGGDLPEPGDPVARSLLEEVLAGPTDPTDPTAPTGPGARTARIAVALDGAEAVALVPLPCGATGRDHTGGGEPDTEPAELRAAELLAEIGEPLSRGLTGQGRLTVGVSAVVHSAEGLRGALEEARHARRVAAARTGAVCVAGHEELASHVLLLPFVPDDVRRAFTARLLEPLRGYDRRHRAELVATLEAFLECDGSWTRCANRLHLHVNTLRYRIGRIEQLTGRDLSRLEDKLDFFLALRMT